LGVETLRRIEGDKCHFWTVTKWDGKFNLKIPPGTALRLAEVSDLVFFRDGYKDFQIKRLYVEGVYGNFAFEGVQLFREFTRNGKSICSIAYKN
jgi:hypothetical protein